MEETSGEPSAPASAPPDILRALIGRVYAHVRRARYRLHVPQGIFWGLIVAVPAMAAHRLSGWPVGLAVGLAAPVLGAAVGAALAWWFTPRPDRTARYIDEKLAGYDQCATAWECLKNASLNQVELELVRLTTEKLEATPLTRIQPDDLPPEARPATALAAVLLLMLVWPMVSWAVMAEPEPLPEVKSLIRELELKLDDLRQRIPRKPGSKEAARAEAPATRRRREYQEEVQERVRKILLKARRSKTLDDAQKLAEEAEQALDDEAITGEDDDHDPRMRELREALEKGDMERAAKVAQQLMKEAQEKGAKDPGAGRDMADRIKRMMARAAAKRLGIGGKRFSKAMVDNPDQAGGSCAQGGGHSGAQGGGQSGARGGGQSGAQGGGNSGARGGGGPGAGAGAGNQGQQQGPRTGAGGGAGAGSQGAAPRQNPSGAGPSGPGAGGGQSQGGGKGQGAGAGASEAEQMKALEKAVDRLSQGDAQGAQEELDRLRRLGKQGGQGAAGAGSTGSAGPGEARGSAGGAGGMPRTRPNDDRAAPGKGASGGPVRTVRGRVLSSKALKQLQGKSSGKGGSMAFGTGEFTLPDGTKSDEPTRMKGQFKDSMSEYLSQEKVPGEYRTIIKDYFSTDDSQ
ncbi:MAG: hypothetical protein HY815_28775 [Candidatus Riflebacteria bacterium]|nr:hypothetical protein [Candidatus Riflebacteria bacterium]